MKVVLIVIAIFLIAGCNGRTKNTVAETQVVDDRPITVPLEYLIKQSIRNYANDDLIAYQIYTYGIIKSPIISKSDFDSIYKKIEQWNINRKAVSDCFSEINVTITNQQKILEFMDSSGTNTNGTTESIEEGNFTIVRITTTNGKITLIKMTTEPAKEFATEVIISKPIGLEIIDRLIGMTRAEIENKFGLVESSQEDEYFIGTIDLYNSAKISVKMEKEIVSSVVYRIEMD